MDNNITVRIDSELKNWLKEYAYQNRTTLSDVIRDCLEKFMTQTNR